MDDGLIDRIAAVRAPSDFSGAGVRAFMTGRRGGFSEGPHAAADGGRGLNLGSGCGDDARCVAANRDRVATAVGRPVRWLRQVHGIEVARDGIESVGAADFEDAAGFDAAVTMRNDIALAIQVADCLPVLLRSRDGRVVGGAHAGWRGLAAGVIESTVEAMRNAVGASAPEPSRELVAWLAPSIGPQRFETGAEVRGAFCDHDPTAANAFMPSVRAGRWMADLPLLATMRLQALGVSVLGVERRCTHDHPESFWSYRRDPRCGRMAALIWIV